MVALIIVFLMLVAIFNHWGYPLLIMTSIPLGVAGGIAGLAVMNLTGDIKAWLGFASLQQPFDMISMLGFLILMGVVINNPILLVHRAIKHVLAGGRRDGAGLARAVRQCLHRSGLDAADIGAVAASGSFGKPRAGAAARLIIADLGECDLARIGA